SLRLVPAAAVALAATAIAGAGPAGAQVNPPGNNGTVKIDGVAFDDHPDNEPHVGCEFQVDLYGYDEGDLQATVTFEAVAPTAGGELVSDVVDIGGDPAGGGTDLDASATYDLTDALAGIEPHPQQGWHVRLTINAEGAQGADVKHKVFWVTGCETPPTTPETTPTTKPPETTMPPTTPTTPGQAPTPPGGELPETGSTTAPLVAAGLGFILLGGAGIAGARRLRSRQA
ncbi:MAG TPA: LPXTG cell wall anchor domain-containing protein, partial [Acidimicrobiales bacterium]